MIEERLLPLCNLGNFSCFCWHLLTFFKVNFLKPFFQDQYYQNVKWFGSRSGPMVEAVCKIFQQTTKVTVKTFSCDAVITLIFNFLTKQFSCQIAPQSSLNTSLQDGSQKK